jgi:predicted  nucleic acid-binding Zn-ribbon protein
VKETIRALVALQRMDNQIAIWRNQMADGPKRLAEARQKLEALEEELNSLNDALAKNQSRRRELETETADLANLKEVNQVRQLKAKNNDEYRAVLKEAEAIVAQTSIREDELLVLMEEAEKMEKRLPDLTDSFEKEKAAFAKVASAVKKTTAESQKLEEKAQVERTKITEAIPKEALGRYLIVAKNRGGQGMAPVSDGLCQICRLSVPPQLFNELKSNKTLLSCPNCARIIYWPDHPDLKPEEEAQADPSLKAHG